MADRIKCDSCGRFIANHRLPASHNEFVPLNEFGPESSEWTCPECLERRDNLWEKW